MAHGPGKLTLEPPTSAQPVQLGRPRTEVRRLRRFLLTSSVWTELASRSPSPPNGRRVADRRLSGRPGN
jgi:hypothetical protein